MPNLDPWVNQNDDMTKIQLTNLKIIYSLLKMNAKI